MEGIFRFWAESKQEGDLKKKTLEELIKGREKAQPLLRR